METEIAEPPVRIGTYPPIQLTMSKRRAARRRVDGQMARTRLMAFIIDYKQKNDGNSPSTQQMMAGASISSTSIVQYHLRILERDGKVRCARGMPRHIVVIGGRWTYEEQDHATKRVLPKHS